MYRVPACEGESMAPPEYEPRYLAGIEHFNAGDYFEAHEVWEEAWLVEKGSARQALHGLIQIAAALHKASRGERPRGCRLLLKWGTAKLGELPDSCCGFALERLRLRLRAFRDLAENWERGETGAPPAGAFPKIFLTARRPPRKHRARTRGIRRTSTS